jgi:hypothetical protein
MSSTDQTLQMYQLRIWMDTPDESSDLASRLYLSQAMKWLWFEIKHRFAMLQIDRHRVLMVHDQPLAVDLTEASSPT